MSPVNLLSPVPPTRCATSTSYTLYHACMLPAAPDPCPFPLVVPTQVNQSMANMALMESERSTRAERQAAAAVAAQQPARLLVRACGEARQRGGG